MPSNARGQVRISENLRLSLRPVPPRRCFSHTLEALQPTAPPQRRHQHASV